MWIQNTQKNVGWSFMLITERTNHGTSQEKAEYESFPLGIILNIHLIGWFSITRNKYLVGVRYCLGTCSFLGWSFYKSANRQIEASFLMHWQPYEVWAFSETWLASYQGWTFLHFCPNHMSHGIVIDKHRQNNAKFVMVMIYIAVCLIKLLTRLKLSITKLKPDMQLYHLCQ